MSNEMFNNYNEIAPDKEGEYIFKIESKCFKGVFIEFVSKMRWRGAGLKNVLSPDFDYWDGYNLLLPKTILWRESKGKSQKIISINDKKLKKCPFCKNNPTINFAPKYVAGNPISIGKWSLSCCYWISRYGSSRENPVNLINDWNDKLTKTN